jgi:hypothetical protein
MPGAPVPYLPSANDRIPDAPVTVENYHRSYEGPMDGTERAYQAGIKRNFDAQQVRMGPLDGAWTVRGSNGAAISRMVESAKAWASQVNLPGVLFRPVERRKVAPAPGNGVRPPREPAIPGPVR